MLDLSWGRTHLLLAGATVALATVGGAAEPKTPIGYCTDDLEKAKAVGFDYAELGVRNFAGLSDPDFAKLLATKEGVGLPTPVGNVFLPGDLKVVGPEIDERRQMDYVRVAFARARKLGLGIIVFGSGGSRKIPDGFSRDEAFQQLVEFARRIAPEAARNDIVVAVEPLRKEETNIINTVAEGLTWVDAVDHPSFQLMVDFYHLASEKEDPGILLRAAKHIRHVHFANPIGRVFPRGADEYDYAPFFASLRQMDYRGRISIEAKPQDLETDAPKAIRFLRSSILAAPLVPGN
jgi:D-psicose/D-tagatose/L-ribulose 3-epimerase